MSSTMEKRAAFFWHSVDRNGPNGCWIWKGAVTSKWGYGCFAVGEGRVLGAHRIAWFLTQGDPGSLCVLHRCDNRVCVNPAHLFLGTKQDNANDKVAKGRQVRGEGTRHAVLTPALVMEIRTRFKKTGRRTNAKELAAEYGVGPTMIYRVVTGRNWKHLPMPEGKTHAQR